LKKKAKKPAKKSARAKRVRPPAISQSVPESILAAVRRIPRGKVCTYGNVAEVAGLPRRARLVGTVLRQTPSARGLPWYRVINAGGRISFPVGSDAYQRQRHKLEAEGVVFVGGRVDLRRYGWPARDEQLDELLWKPDPNPYQKSPR
jgi:methylated-DNA-protein-cysteine methyltransferase-like protein